MDEDLQRVATQPPTMTRPIPHALEQWQSAWLVWGMVIYLSCLLGLQIFVVVGMEGPPVWFLWSAAASAVFALLVWALRAGTGPAAAAGGFICLQILMGQAFDVQWNQTGMPSLIFLVVLTFLATRFGRRHKERLGTAESRRGRRAAQVVANLGMAGYFASGPGQGHHLATCAVLAEAAADTVSSELGQVLDGRTFLITSGKPVPPGTDGGISLAGTFCGLLTAALIAFAAGAIEQLTLPGMILVFLAGSSGLFFDSLLGATVERYGWIGNDLVNFASTAVAGSLALSLSKYLTPLPL